MDIVSALFKSPKRGFSLFVPQVVINENHTDGLQIASHPVEMGAQISDHAWKTASSVIMTCGFGSGGSLFDSVNTTALGIEVGLSPAQIYQEILKLQASRSPFNVVTGLRTYRNMLLTQISVTGDISNDKVLICTLTLTEVILSATQVLVAADKTSMSKGVSTSSVQNGGTRTTTPMGQATVNIRPL